MANAARPTLRFLIYMNIMEVLLPIAKFRGVVGFRIFERLHIVATEAKRVGVFLERFVKGTGIGIRKQAEMLTKVRRMAGEAIALGDRAMMIGILLEFLGDVGHHARVRLVRLIVARQTECRSLGDESVSIRSAVWIVALDAIPAGGYGLMRNSRIVKPFLNGIVTIVAKLRC